MSLLESIRRWIDGEQGEDLLEAADEHSKPRRIWEEFLVKIAREVEAVMQREMFTPPGGLTYIPREYVVYLSAEDDKDWQGDKRRGLEQGLFHVLSERAKELSGSNQLAAKSFAVELRVDGTLEKGQFRVQAVWDETETRNQAGRINQMNRASKMNRANKPWCGHASRNSIQWSCGKTGCVKQWCRLPNPKSRSDAARGVLLLTCR